MHEQERHRQPGSRFLSIDGRLLVGLDGERVGVIRHGTAGRAVILERLRQRHRDIAPVRGHRRDRLGDPGAETALPGRAPAGDHPRVGRGGTRVDPATPANARMR
jgi:hypothetical protein